MRRLTVMTAAAILLGAACATLVAGSAQADTPVLPVYTDTTGSGSGSIVGLDADELARYTSTNGNNPTKYDGGGWTTDTNMVSQAPLTTCGNTTLTAVCPGTTDHPNMPVSCWLGEPAMYTAANPQWQLGLTVFCHRYDNNSAGSPANVVFSAANGATGTASTATCSETARSSTGDLFTMTTGTSGDVALGPNSTPASNDSLMAGFPYSAFHAASYCPFLVQIDAYFYYADSATHVARAHFVWTASQALAPRIYGTTDDRDGACLALNTADRSETACAGAALGTDFATVCADLPTFDPLDWSWMPNLIGQLAKCLFVPVDGWDPGGKVGVAVDQSGIGHAVDAITPALAAIAPAEACGNIVDGDIGMFGHLTIDTCGWGWASGIKQVATWGVIILGGWAVLRFVLAQFSAMFGIQSALDDLDKKGST